ncbi:MAG: imidazole glycerol phosphate synthase subunit HisH [Ignavibacteriae bacterium HGW-Ignavibacteriae-2]|nr:imidazole glycerol phosphate synthase subunit HisH [Bacteroidota bacterium]PKL88789.1 MAG: imidazole glycerol phosphate synthase subunit HisH [Ignavibacteriae bacterium HGW-Ignavibacteriae-2]
MTIIVDYNMGNLRSVQKSFERINVDAKISDNPDDIISAEKLILPGVGHFSQGMKNLTAKGLISPLNKAVLEKKTPILGICLGMQLMTKFSEEGNLKGLSWIDADVKKISVENTNLRIPHMGWNSIDVLKSNSILNNIPQNNLLYFVHSYYVKCDNLDNVLATTEYGIPFVSSFQNQNIFGCQFHPEKSYDDGLTILNNFNLM